MGIVSTKVIREPRVYHLGNLKAGSSIGGACQEGEVPYPARRREARVSEQKVCAYGLCESIEGESVIIEQGEVYSLNQSEHGILVMMGFRPRNQQILELHVAETRWEYSLNLYEVQWVKAISVESHGLLFLAGCRLVFGGSRYWAF